MATVTESTFRADFPAFADTTQFPPARVAFWLGLAASMLDESVWGNQYTYGVELLVAHNLSLEAADMGVAAASGAIGATSGLMTAKAVDKVSASYDVASITVDGGGTYNETRFGRMFLRLVRGFGAGGLQF